MIGGRLRRHGLLGIALLGGILLACRAPGDGAGTSAPLAPETSALHPTSTSPAGNDAHVEIPGRALVWQQGTYITNRFVVPLTFTVKTVGWRSFGAEDTWVMVTYVRQTERSESAVSVVFLAYEPYEPAEAVAEAITSIEGVLVLSGPTPTRVGDQDAMVFDVEGLPDPTLGDPCSLPAGSGRWFTGWGGYALFDEGLIDFGIPACYLSRVWVVDVEGTTVTIVASTEQPEDFEPFMAEVERLLADLQFRASG